MSERSKDATITSYVAIHVQSDKIFDFTVCHVVYKQILNKSPRKTFGKLARS